LSNDTPIPLRTDISPSLRGSFFKAVYNEALGDIAEGKVILAHGAAALEPMYAALGAIIDAHAAANAAARPAAPMSLGIVNAVAASKEERNAAAMKMLRDSAQNDKTGLNPTHENALKRHMTAAFNKVAPRVDANLTKMREARKALESKLERAIEAHSAHDNSTRHFLTHTEEGQKAKKGAAYTKALGLLSSAGERETRAIAGALIGVPSFLTGLNQKQEGEIRNAVARRLAPKEHAALEAADKAIAHVEQARATFIAEYTKRLPKGVSKVSAADTALDKLAAVS
jgi:hypothetical protein